MFWQSHLRQGFSSLFISGQKVSPWPGSDPNETDAKMKTTGVKTLWNEVLVCSRLRKEGKTPGNAISSEKNPLQINTQIQAVIEGKMIKKSR